MAEYKYGMRLRGFSPGCQPMKGLVRVEHQHNVDKWWDILVYDRELDYTELFLYDLDKVEEEK